MTNPYESPQSSGAIETAPGSDAPAIGVVARLGRALFWFGVVIALLGLQITFIPGGECGWFLFSGALIACGLLVPNRRYRIAAALGLVLCLAVAMGGYVRGIEFRRRYPDGIPNEIFQEESPVYP